MQQSRPEQKRQSLIQCVIDHAESELRTQGIAQDKALQLATSIADRLADAFGGQLITFPKEYSRKLHERDAQILADFNGSNFPELVMRYGMCDRSIRKLIERAKARQPVVAA